MKPALLCVAMHQEFADLMEWLSAHKDEDEYKDLLPGPTLAWMQRIAAQLPEDLPAFVPVPMCLIPCLDCLFEDWGEVAEANDEPLLTALVYGLEVQ